MVSKSALLVIDLQRYFLEPRAPAFIKGGRKIIPNVLRLIEHFRKNKMPVIFTRHAHVRGKKTGQMGRWWDQKLLWEGDNDSKLIKEIKPLRGELVITKSSYSAFEKTELEKYLNKKRINTIIICGVMTHLCVETTARHAFILDFQPIIVSDACASKAKKYHEASLLNLAHGFADIVKTSLDINWLNM